MHFTMTLDSSRPVLPRTGFKICYQRAPTTSSNSQNRDDKLRCFFLAPLCFAQDFLQKVNLCRHQMAAQRRWFWSVSHGTACKIKIRVNKYEHVPSKTGLGPSECMLNVCFAKDRVQQFNNRQNTKRFLCFVLLEPVFARTVCKNIKSLTKWPSNSCTRQYIHKVLESMTIYPLPFMYRMTYVNVFDYLS